MRNDYICDKVGVDLMANKIRESRFGWFGRIKCWSSDDPVKRIDVVYVKKGRGQPKMTWLGSIKNDINLSGLN